MTTAWSWLAHGQPGRAAAANVSACLLWLMSVVAGPWLLAAACRGRWLAWTPNSNVLAVVAVLMATLVLSEWIIRLLASGPGGPWGL